MASALCSVRVSSSLTAPSCGPRLGGIWVSLISQGPRSVPWFAAPCRLGRRGGRRCYPAPGRRRARGLRPSPELLPNEPSAAAMSSGASVSALQRVVEQLKLEAGVERIKVSQAAAELQQYCMQNACKDALLVGVPAGSNPFREPRSCALL